MEKLNCYCGKSFEIEINKTIELDKDSIITDQILNNKFMEYHCPSCNKILRPEFRINFIGNGIDLTMIPEIERDSYLAGTNKQKAKQIVIGFQELREKIIIHNLNFNERTIELIKLYLLKKTNSKPDIKIFFENLKNDYLIFYIYGLKENETGISKLPKHIYTTIDENLEERLKDREIKELLDLPYISINKIIPEVQ